MKKKHNGVSRDRFSRDSFSRDKFSRDRAKDMRLRREYNLTLDEYNAILAFQNHSCAICKRPQASLRVALSVDHCHKSGLVRGLLCMTCNRALGKFQDSLTKLQSAVAYLTHVPAVLALQREIISAPGRIGTKSRAKAIDKSRKALQQKTINALTAEIED